MGHRNWYYPPNGGARQCRDCHAAHKRRAYTRKRVQELLPKRIAEMKTELDKLRQDYESDPKNARLSEAVGLAEQKYRWASTYETREQEKRAATAAAIRSAEEYRNRPRWDNGEWTRRLEAAGRCPHCNGRGVGLIEIPLPAVGYSVRLGEYGVRCDLCRKQWNLEVS